MSKKLYTPLSIIGEHANFSCTCIYSIGVEDKYEIVNCYAGFDTMGALAPALKNDVFLYLRKDMMYYSKEDLLKWLRFLKYAGFKFQYLGEKEIPIDTGYGCYNLSTYKLKFNCGDFVNQMHIFAALTALRYIFYGWRSFFKYIPQICFELKNNIKGLDAISTLQIAFFCKTDGVEHGHSFIGISDKYPNRYGWIVSKKNFYKRLKIKMLNRVLYKEDGERKWDKVREFYKNKDFKAIKHIVFSACPPEAKRRKLVLAGKLEDKQVVE